MEQLWAPWRMDYIENADTPQGCIFCQLPGADPREAHVIWKGEKAFVVLNAFPYNNGHLMVAPYEHVANLEDLQLDTLTEMMALTQDSIRALKRDFNPDGLNIGFNLGAVAGAGVKDHVHLHIVPRWAGDTNFMPVLCDVRVIPQSLDRAYDLLVHAFAEIKGGKDPSTS